MTPYLFRTIGLGAFAIMLAIVVIWLLQELQVVALIDDPLIGVIAFGLLGMILYGLGKKGAGDKTAEP